MSHRRIPRGVFASALLVGLAHSMPTAAQAPSAATPPAKPAVEAAAGIAVPGVPRIGLALSGGGARGLAHVGVLKVLEEMRIPISCISGTSMGAIVGGTYASGRPADEMAKIVVAARWDDLFRDAPPRKEIAVRRKFDDYKTLFKPEFGIKDGGLMLPKGVIAGVSIEAFFRELATPAFGIGDFNKLPIPFHAMATDIETGESVVLDHGSLSQAMRASMSVPGAIAPVEIDGRLLVDGGIANNLPIGEARRMCGDVIIAVNISTPPLKREDLTSALSVTAQLINFLGKQTVDEQIRSLGAKDVLISPDLGDISAGSFTRAEDAITIGEKAARAMADKLARYSVTPEQYAVLRMRQVAEAKALGSVDEIRVEGLKRTNPAVAKSLIESKPGEPLTEEKLGADLRRIYGTGDFESINYQIVGGETGPRVMLIEPVEKSWGPNYLRFGLGLASDFSGDSQFNALVQYRRTWMNRLGAEWTTELQVGQDTHLGTEFYQPLNEAGKWFIAPSAFVGQQTRGLFIGEEKVAEYLTSVTQGALDVGAVLGTWGQLRVGARHVPYSCPRRNRFAAAAVGAGNDGRAARGDLHRPDRQRVVCALGLRTGRNGIRGDGFARIQRELQPRGSHWARRPELGAAHIEPCGQRRLVAQLRHAGLRIVLAGRTAAPVGLSHQRAGRASVHVRPADVLQPHIAAARPSGLGHLCRRFGRSRSHERSQ